MVAQSNKIIDNPVEAPKVKKMLSDFNLKVGDLVTLQSYTVHGGGIIFRIVKDSKPRMDAVRMMTRQFGYMYNTWCDPVKGKEIPHLRLYGCIELFPVFNFMSFKAKKHSVEYRHIPSRIKKVDLLALGKTFAEFQMFITEEMKKLQGNGDD